MAWVASTQQAARYKAVHQNDPKQISAVYASQQLAAFYEELAAKQERLGPEFESVLYENRWDLYAR